MAKSHAAGQASQPTPAQLKELFSQIEAGRVTKESLQDFLRGQTPALPSYAVTVDYSQTVEQMVKAGRYDWANDAITSRNFPSREKGRAQLDIFLLNFDSNISSEDAVKAMDAQGLRPATLKELLALGVVHPDLQRKNPIVALGSTWRDPRGHLDVPCLRGYGSYRRLDLAWFEGDWNPHGRFAAVRK